MGDEVGAKPARGRYLLGAVFMALALSTGTASAGMIGSSTAITYRAPAFSSIYFNAGYPLIADGTSVDFSGLVNLTFSDTQITITNLPPAGMFALTTFNGVDISFLSGAPITNVTIDPASSSVFATGALLAFGLADINLNLAGTCDGCVGGEKIILDVTTGVAAVPEPMSLALLGAGLLGLVATRRRGR